MSSSSELAPRVVAFFSPRLISGGTQRHLLEVLRFIDRARFRPLVISVKSGGPLCDAVRGGGVELVELGLGPTMISWDVLRCVRAAARLLRDRRVDVVQFFEWRSGVIALAATWLAGRGRIVAGRRSVRRERGTQGLLAELVVRAADRIVVNAEGLRPRGRAAGRTDVIPSGVDTERFRAHGTRSAMKAKLGVAAERPLVGAVGRLEARKGTATLLEAAALVRARGQHDVAVAVVGDGPLRDELVAQGSRLGLADDLLMLGDRADVRDVLAALDVFVLPSRTEGMSNALLEAMAMERPVVATAVGGTPEVVTTEVNGLLVPPDAPAAMAEAMARVLRDPGLGERLGAAARQTVEARHGSRAMVRRLEAVYASVAACDEVRRDHGRRAHATSVDGHALEECHR